jgi:hypothetical protein
MMIFMASFFRRRAERARACSVREVAAWDEGRSAADPSFAGWTDRVDWKRADRNCLPSYQRRAAQAQEGGPERGVQLAEEGWAERAAQEWAAPVEVEAWRKVATAAPEEDGLGEERLRDLDTDRDADCRYRCCD